MKNVKLILEFKVKNICLEYKIIYKLIEINIS